MKYKMPKNFLKKFFYKNINKSVNVEFINLFCINLSKNIKYFWGLGFGEIGRAHV